MIEGLDFELYQYMALENSMIKNQINVKILATYQDPFLPCFKTKATTLLKQEWLELIEQCMFKV